MWKKSRTCTIGKQTRQDGIGKGDAHGGKEEFSGSMTDVGNGWCNETNDDERFIKPRNWLKIPLKVRNALTAASLKKLPKTTPKMMAMMILAKSGVLTFAKSGILILFIFVVLLFDCKGTFFLTKPQFFSYI